MVTQTSIAFIPDITELRWRDKEYIADRFLDEPNFNSVSGKPIYTGKAKTGFDIATMNEVLNARYKKFKIRPYNVNEVEERILFTQNTPPENRLIVFRVK